MTAGAGPGAPRCAPEAPAVRQPPGGRDVPRRRQCDADAHPGLRPALTPRTRGGTATGGSSSRASCPGRPPAPVTGRARTSGRYQGGPPAERAERVPGRADRRQLLSRDVPPSAVQIALPGVHRGHAVDAVPAAQTNRGRRPRRRGSRPASSDPAPDRFSRRACRGPWG